MAPDTLRLTGTVMHNGVEHVNAHQTGVWLARNRVVVSYRVAMPDEFPEPLVVACPGFTYLDIRVTGLAAKPAEVLIYPSYIAFEKPKLVPYK